MPVINPSLWVMFYTGTAFGFGFLTAILVYAIFLMGAILLLELVERRKG